jgi:hypothetical protein
LKDQVREAAARNGVSVSIAYGFTRHMRIGMTPGRADADVEDEASQ